MYYLGVPEWDLPIQQFHTPHSAPLHRLIRALPQMPLCHYSAATIAMSSSSSSSTRSLRSKGIINPLNLDGTLNGRKSQKKAAHWTDEQEEPSWTSFMAKSWVTEISRNLCIQQGQTISCPNTPSVHFHTVM
jgi:hypothetical protein